MGMLLDITEELPEGKPNLAIFHLVGALDGQSENQLVRAVKKASELGVRYVMLDFRDTRVLTSAGIRAIQKAHQILKSEAQESADTHIRLCNAPPNIREVLSITGVLNHMPMYDSTEAGIASFGT